MGRCAGEIKDGKLRLGVMKSTSTNVSYTGRFSTGGHCRMEGAAWKGFGDSQVGQFESGQGELYQLILGEKIDSILKCVNNTHGSYQTSQLYLN